MASQDNTFRLSRKARAGALLLLFLLILAVVIWRWLPMIRQAEEEDGSAELEQAWVQFNKENKARGNSYRESRDDTRERKPYRRENRTVHLKPFDPNKASEEELLSLGLPERTAKTLVKYRSKGGHFRRAEDLQKLYTLSTEDYERIAPYVRIPEAAGGQRTYREPLPPKVPEIVELNEADAEALIALRGIGPGYARRILNFREALGGFLAVEQLKEVYGFPDSTYQQLKDRFVADPAKVRKLNVNTASEEELARHPYIGRRLAPGIIKLRNDLHNYADIEQIRQVPLINEEKYRKIAPYLSTH